MIVLAHRGLWQSEAEKNTEAAFRRALDCNFGIETDIRDYNRRVVISHDMATEKAMELKYFFEMYRQYLPTELALNVKSDGLQDSILLLIKEYKIENYFLFDMSVPDMLGYILNKMTVFSRRSEYEHSEPLEGITSGVWLDQLSDKPLYLENLDELLSSAKRIAMVSPELHGRPHQNAWNEWRAVLRDAPTTRDKILICTDFPCEAREFFDS